MCFPSRSLQRSSLLKITRMNSHLICQNLYIAYRSLPPSLEISGLPASIKSPSIEPFNSNEAINTASREQRGNFILGTGSLFRRSKKEPPRDGKGKPSNLRLNELAKRSTRMGPRITGYIADLNKQENFNELPQRWRTKIPRFFEAPRSSPFNYRWKHLFPGNFPARLWPFLKGTPSLSALAAIFTKRLACLPRDIDGPRRLPLIKIAHLPFLRGGLAVKGWTERKTFPRANSLDSRHHAITPRGRATRRRRVNYAAAPLRFFRRRSNQPDFFVHPLYTPERLGARRIKTVSGSFQLHSSVPWNARDAFLRAKMLDNRLANKRDRICGYPDSRSTSSRWFYCVCSVLLFEFLTEVCLTLLGRGGLLYWRVVGIGFWNFAGRVGRDWIVSKG